MAARFGDEGLLSPHSRATSARSSSAMFLSVNRDAACGSISKFTPRGGFLSADNMGRDGLGWDVVHDLPRDMGPGIV